jgi:chromate reductase, NAD(P)H dehydrogenase (quinone)
MPKHKIAVLVGSLRKDSFSKKLAQALVALAPDTLSFEFIDLGAMEIYNQDFDDENRAPASYAKFRERMRACDGVLFVTPEYNRSIPGVLKNALDVGSRPYGKSVWDQKPGAVVSNSPGALGGFGANHHLRQCLVFLNVPVMQQPEAYIGNVAKLLKEDGAPADDKAKEFLRSIITAYGAWVERLAAGKASA